MKSTLTVFILILVLTACSHHPGGDAALRAKIVGSWTTAGVVLPDRAEVTDVMTTFQPDGSWVSRYTISRAGGSRTQTTGGSWQIENGFMIELQTNVDGVADTKEQQGGSKIIRLDSHEMILSNWYSPRRTFSRTP